MSDDYTKTLGGITYVYPSRTHGPFPRIHAAHAHKDAAGNVTPSFHALCGVRSGGAARLGQGMCQKCERLHPVWGNGDGWQP